MSKCADKRVGDKADEIVSSLVEGTLAGNASAARILVDLAEGADWTESAEHRQRILSLAETWAAEPQWSGELTEADAETSSGPREPEDLFPILQLPGTSSTSEL